MATLHTDPIRKAVAGGDFQPALRLWNDYAAGIREEICRGSCTEARMAEAQEFMEWARRMVRCTCAEAQDRLNAMHVAGQYSHASEPASFLRTSL
jgi:hypothetical protein